MSDHKAAVPSSQPQVEEGTHPQPVSLDMSRVLLRAAATLIVSPGWHRERINLSPDGVSTLDAIALAARPFGWPPAEHFARWSAAALQVHGFLGLTAHGDALADLDAWDRSPERTAGDVYDLLEGASTGLPRCRVGALAHEGSIGPSECWRAATHRGWLCEDHLHGGWAWTGNRDGQPWSDDDADLYPYSASASAG